MAGISRDEDAINAARDALAHVIDTGGFAEDVYAFLRALRPGVVCGLADLGYVEWEGRRVSAVIKGIVAELLPD